MDRIDRIDRIIHDRRFTEALQKLRIYEKGRIFCGHDLKHFLDVARIAWIYILEHHLNYKKDVVYAMGLLHDIGRICQYEENIPHHEAGACMASAILKDAGYDEAETALVKDAILHHRKEENEDPASLNAILYMADKKSRSCYMCDAIDLCHWPDSIKNKSVTD